MNLAATGNSLEPIFSLLFWAVVIGGSVLYSASKKKRQARESVETQQQLRRVDEAIRAARQRAAALAPQGAAYSVPETPAASVTYEVTSSGTSSYEVSSPAFRPGSFAVSAGSIPFALPAVPEPASQGRTAKAAPSLLPTASLPSAGFVPASNDELMEALAWREIFAPCIAMRP